MEGDYVPPKGKDLRGNPIPRGRPKKSTVLAKKQGNRSPGKPGRPVGDSGRIQEYKARLLAAPTANGIISKLISIANDDKHPGQMAALKMAVDRILPVHVFEKDREGNRPQITINVTGMLDVSETQLIEHSDDEEDDDVIDV